ncbi:MAG: hypothetical protein H7062_19555 [Candidatus Saccharimonas sp.]|nr:hypothetical protein [Planctomycetaceae bacterium]
MKVLIVAEGKHERSGSLETLVRRLLSGNPQFDMDDIHRRLSPLHGIGGFDYCKRALQWIQEAQKRGYDAIVLLLDEDGYSDRIKGIDQAQVRLSKTAMLPRALGVAIHAFDAWMLADEQALSDTLSRTVPCQPAPEGIRDPKSVCQQLRDETLGCELGLAEMYGLVAEKTNLEILELRCSSGFKPFADRVRALASTI